jgi:branched-chain amino acid transport system ATP-binding protein
LADDPILTLTDVVGGYGENTILNGTSFAVPRGAITTIIGPNGAGKSTVFRAVFGLLRVRQGRIAFDRRDVTNRPPRALLAAGIVYIPQGRNLFGELSVRHNLEIGGVMIEGRADFGARIEAALDRFPMLRAKAGHQASTLSGGEQKLLEIARGLLLDPKLILIDEPSVGLSPRMTAETFAILRGLRDQGVSVLMVEQNARQALAMSDHALVLELGRTRLAGPAAAIAADPRIGQLFLGGSLEAETENTS